MSPVGSRLSIWMQNLGRTAIGPQSLAFMPALILGGYWFGGEWVLLLIAMVVPVLASMGRVSIVARKSETETGGVLPDRQQMIDCIDAHLASDGAGLAALALEIDDFDRISIDFNDEAAENVLAIIGQRLRRTIRPQDILASTDPGKFGLAVLAMRKSDLETLIQLSARLQSAISEPIDVGGTRIYLTATVGFAVPDRVKSHTGKGFVAAAETALATARAHGFGAIRSFSPDMTGRPVAPTAEKADLTQALEDGQFVAWFQPQTSTDTGQITGFEALARWNHPAKGLLLPADFMTQITEFGLQAQLGTVILDQALSALTAWDLEGLEVEQVSVNFSARELSDPQLADRIGWELDRRGLSAERIVVEVLEDVVSAPQEDVIARNIRLLSQLGCRIDLDDFGTGHASLANIRRFSVDRIKIDRSFISRVDKDRDQQSMVAAILTMADRLNLDTLAEGVETSGEHAMLSQLGCGHIQGFSVGRPMPLAETGQWITEYRDKIHTPPLLDQKIRRI